MQPSVLYIPYDISHEQTGDIITFKQSEEDNLVEKKCNAEEYRSILASIDESSTGDDYDDGSIITNNLKYIQDRSKTHPELNARDDRLKIRDHIKKIKNEFKGA